MLMLISATQRKMKTLLDALKKAKTGDIIVISPAPAGIQSGESFAHMGGLMSKIGDMLYLNNSVVCRTDSALTHGSSYIPFYEWVLIHRKNAGVHEFLWMLPTDPNNPKRNTSIVPSPAFRYEAKELEVKSLSSGKGLVLVSDNPPKIQLLKKLRVLGTTWNVISAKNVDANWEGRHTIWFDAPSTLVVGHNISKQGEPPIIRFSRGHGRRQVAVHDYSGASLIKCLATDTDFFYRDKDSDKGGSYISAATGQTFYTGMKGQFYVTTNALVRHEVTIVEANGGLVTDSFNSELVVPHAHGLIYVWNGEIRMLVIK